MKNWKKIDLKELREWLLVLVAYLTLIVSDLQGCQSENHVNDAIAENCFFITEVIYMDESCSEIEYIVVDCHGDSSQDKDEDLYVKWTIIFK